MKYNKQNTKSILFDMTIIHKRLLSHLSTNLYFLINPTPPPHAATQPSFFRILLRLPPFTRQPVKTLRILTPFASLNSIFRGLSKSLPTCNGSAAPRTPSNRECPTQPPSSTPQTSFNHPQTPTVILKPTRTTQKHQGHVIARRGSATRQSHASHANCHQHHLILLLLWCTLFSRQSHWLRQMLILPRSMLYYGGESPHCPQARTATPPAPPL